MINPQELKELVDKFPKLVTAKRSVRYPELRVLKYTRKVFYDNLWSEHPLLVECRGLVVDDDYNIIVKPFTKVFNYGENGTQIDRDEMCTVVRKINGFMACLTNWNGKALVSTTGSLDSKYVDLASNYILKYNDLIFKGDTAIFEIVDPSDPHIIKEQPGSYLIGLNEYSKHDIDFVHYNRKIGDFVPSWQYVRFSDIVKRLKFVRHEGYMVYGHSSGTVLKLKSPFYLITKLFARMKGERLEKILKGNGQIKVDEDYLHVVEYLRKNADEFLKLDEQGKVCYVREFLNA